MRRTPTPAEQQCKPYLRQEESVSHARTIHPQHPRTHTRIRTHVRVPLNVRGRVGQNKVRLRRDKMVTFQPHGNVVSYIASLRFSLRESMSRGALRER